MAITRDKTAKAKRNVVRYVVVESAPEVPSPMFEIGDTVRIVGGGSEVWTIVGSRSVEPCWQIQRGKDAASIQWKQTSELELVAKAKKPDSGPGFVPTRGIMD